MVNKDAGCGKIGNQRHNHIPSGNQVKTLLNDSTSGGLEVVPIFFDTNLVTTPLLTGDPFPYVEVVDVPRGASMGRTRAAIRCSACR
ncbi:MAG: hypothetical protein HYX69_03155 [Planctomycetia bacterium]|nr:hypothetical protein [Planctomycetia bacterium]